MRKKGALVEEIVGAGGIVDFQAIKITLSAYGYKFVCQNFFDNHNIVIVLFLSSRLGSYVAMAEMEC